MTPTRRILGGQPTMRPQPMPTLANPQPPKPDEPLGLGAVVEDADGVRYIRHPGTLAPWRRADATDQERPWRYWSGIEAVKVLSEGVQS